MADLEKQKQPICVYAVAGFLADLTMFLPCNRADIPKPFAKLLKKHGVVSMGADFVRKLDRKKVLTAREREILIEEGRLYLYTLMVYYYLAQMVRDADWRFNIKTDDPDEDNFKAVSHFAHFRLMLCFQSFGLSEDQALIEVANLLHEGKAYYRKNTWEQALRDNSLRPALNKLLHRSIHERMVLNDAKRALIDTYSKSLHDVAAKFFGMLNENYQYVGIRHTEVIKAVSD